MKSADTATLLEFSVSIHETKAHIYVCPEQGGRILVHPSANRGALRVVEAFGGMSGWGFAAKHFGANISAVIEKDVMTAKMCAQTLKTPFLSPQELMTHALQGNHDEVVVVNGCVADPLIWSALTFMNVAFAMASPPCPPWSGAGKERGLSDPES